MQNMCYFMAAMAIQPVIVHKTKSYQPVTIRRFRSITEAKKWLRSEGCKFSNRDMYYLGNDSVELFTETYEYSVEAVIPTNRRQHNG